MSTEQGTSELEELVFAEDGRRVSFTLDETVYPLDAIHGAAYIFLDKAFIFLTRPGDQQVEVRLKPKGEASPAVLEALAGEFANALLDQVVRFRVAESTGRIREYYISRAFFTTPAQSSIDALLAELDAEEREDDELEIEVPWEMEDEGA